MKTNTYEVTYRTHGEEPGNYSTTFTSAFTNPKTLEAIAISAIAKELDIDNFTLGEINYVSPVPKTSTFSYKVAALMSVPKHNMGGVILIEVSDLLTENVFQFVAERAAVEIAEQGFEVEPSDVVIELAKVDKVEQ